MPKSTALQQICTDLRDGAAADIWYDAGDYIRDPDNQDDPDVQAASTIEITQVAMEDAAKLLPRLANALKALAEAAAPALVVTSNHGTDALRAAKAEADALLAEVFEEVDLDSDPEPIDTARDGAAGAADGEQNPS